MARKYGSSQRSNHTFSQVPKAEIQRSSFDRSSSLKTAFDASLLVPIFVDEVLPGDTFNMRATLFGRLATPIKPFIDNLFLETFWFFVPNRLVWQNWEKFMGSQDNPGDSTDFSIPLIIVGSQYAEESLPDYMGIPTKVPVTHSALPLRGYGLIWNEWFRDQNLQSSIVVPIDDGPDPGNTIVLQSRGKRHDYFTSCLPWPQKGDPVTIDLAGTAPVQFTGDQDETFRAQDDAGGNSWEWGGTSPPAASFADQTAGTAFNLQADLANATGFTINQLRQSFQIQRLLERDARGGTRYVEVLKAHFGVTSPDARLQRPEFLAGSSQMITVSQVAQTTDTLETAAGDTPQGNLAGFGVVSGNASFTKSFVEHGYVFGLANVRADLTYQQGLIRMWSRQTRYDFYWPVLAHLGEQAVLSKEIYNDGTANDEDVFGYQEAFGEYRYRPSQVTGKLRSNATETLDIWHAAQFFLDRPVLSDEFITDKAPIDRIIAVQDEPHIILDAYFKLRCARPMPLYGVPGLIDHF